MQHDIVQVLFLFSIKEGEDYKLAEAALGAWEANYMKEQKPVQN